MVLIYTMVYHVSYVRAHAHAHACVRSHDDGRRDDRHDSHLGKNKLRDC